MSKQNSENVITLVTPTYNPPIYKQQTPYLTGHQNSETVFTNNIQATNKFHILQERSHQLIYFTFFGKTNNSTLFCVVKKFVWVSFCGFCLDFSIRHWQKWPLGAILPMMDYNILDIEDLTH